MSSLVAHESMHFLRELTKCITSKLPRYGASLIMVSSLVVLESMHFLRERYQTIANRRPRTENQNNETESLELV